MKTKQLKWVIGSSVLAACIVGVSFMTMKENSVYFYTPDELLLKAMEIGDKEIRVGGMVKTHSVQWDRKSLDLKFVLTDMKGSEFNVDYRGSPPDLFKENSGAVLEGRFFKAENRFQATKLMVKHSEEYRKPDAMHSMEPELIKKSMFKVNT